MRVYKFLDTHFGMKTLAEKRLKISTLEDLNDPFELLCFEMTDKIKRPAVNLARKEWGATTGMLCFSSEWRDPVIWAHYSDKHRAAYAWASRFPMTQEKEFNTSTNACLCQIDLHSVMLPHGCTRNMKIGHTKKRFGVVQDWKRHQRACISWTLEKP
jgi:hypothetical protein